MVVLTTLNRIHKMEVFIYEPKSYPDHRLHK